MVEMDDFTIKLIVDFTFYFHNHQHNTGWSNKTSKLMVLHHSKIPKLYCRLGVVACSCNPATWRRRLVDGLRSGSLPGVVLCRSGVRAKPGINMVSAGELGPQSSHLSLGLPSLLLPCSRNSAAPFGNRSSAILSTCPAHCNLFLTSLSVKLLCTPVSSLNSTILRMSALVTLAIFRTQLFSHTCSLCCCSSVSAKVSVPYRQAGVTQLLMTLPFSLFEIRRSAITPSTISTRSLRPVLFDVPLSLRLPVSAHCPS